ncbi:MAG: HD domain-containing protein [Nitrospira sp.]|nr:HD domain-containing protein [Nitrospira sp.]MCP9462265.1 HD domain-containing protein [Nitrospira sp.]MCP9474478.1 HD domain-containing protein [Nitrospira sp.]
MRTDSVAHVEPTVLKIQRLLEKIDRLRLPAASRRDVESILVRQVSKELDRAIPWQAGHAERTAAVACLIGEAFELDTTALHNLKLAALLHDVGLLMVPEPLRHGCEPLDPSSYVALQHHSRLGANLLEPFAFLRQAAVLIAHHHEWWDGSGYPYGIRGEFIPLGARILAAADAFEAIHVPGVQDRFLRNRIALRILRVASGTQFDPVVVAKLWVASETGSLGASVSPLHGGGR